MRKLIVILLIAVIACTEVDTTPKEEVIDFNELLDLLDLVVNSVELDWLTDIGDKISGFFGNMWDSVKRIIQNMKNNGILDKLKRYSEESRKAEALTYCKKYCSPAICEILIKAMFSH